MLPRTASLAAAAFLLTCAGTRAFALDKKMSDAEFMAGLDELMAETPEAPDVNDAMFEELEDSDMDTWMFVSGSKAHPPAPVNLGGDGRLTLVRPAYREKITAVYRRKNGAYDQEEIKKIQWIMRSGGAGGETPPSLLLLEILDAVEDKFGRKGLVLLSGYRTPHLNSKVPGSARYSMHMLGWAADIRVPGRTARQVNRYAGKLHAGGVGYYPDAAFVHLDSGRQRQWTVRRRK